VNNAVTQFAAEQQSAGLGALGVNGKAFLIQLITFVLTFWILKRFAFQPILRVLTERREIIEDGVRLGEEMQKEQAQLEQKIDAELRAARQKADEIVASSEDAGRQIAAEAEKKAQAKAAGILKQAESRIQQDTALARQKLEKELVGLISDATEAIIDEKVDAKKDSALIEKALKGQAS